MSNHWDIRCLTCGVDHWIDDHKVIVMEAMIRHRAAIAALADLLDELMICTSVYVDLRLSDYGEVDPRWFRDHAEHLLRPVDEHGRPYGQCEEWGRCSLCDDGSASCYRDAGHAGAHVLACREHVKTQKFARLVREPDGRRAAPEVTAGAVVRVTRSPDMDESTCPHNFAIDPETDTCLTCGARL